MAEESEHKTMTAVSPLDALAEYRRLKQVEGLKATSLYEALLTLDTSIG